MLRTSVKRGLSILTAVFAATAAQAADVGSKAPEFQPAAPAAPVPAVPWMLGDWNGARTRLLQQGIDFQLGYVGEVATNLRGGTQNLASYADQYTFGTTFDLNRLFGIQGATFQITFTERTGRNLSADANLGTLMQVQEIFGRGQTARLTQFWWDQKFFYGLIDWKIGRLGVGEDFAAFSCDFQNLTFCGSMPGNIRGDYIFNWPISQWATRLKFNFRDFGYFQIGVYDENQDYLGTRQALLPVWFSGSTGVLVPMELGWLPTFGNGPLSLPGSYKIGGWFDTSDAADVVTDINGNFVDLTGQPAAQVHGRYGAYFNFKQQLTRTSAANPAGGLSMFLNGVWADHRTAFTDSQLAGGLVYTGIQWLGRPDDDFAFAAGMTHVNDRVADVQSLINAAGFGPVPVQGTEYAFEVYYTFRPVTGLLFRPNIQYVLHPGGTNLNQDAIVFGLKTVASF